MLDTTTMNTVRAASAVADVKCFKCKTPIKYLRSFKCHNWAYAVPALLEMLQEMERKAQ